MEKTRKRLFLAVNLAALAAILYWMREHISFAEVVDQMRALPLEGLIGALVLNVAVLGVYGVRLALLLGSRRLPALAVVIIGFGMNGVLPFRLGEVAKLAYARQLFGIATPRLIAATAAEKLMDLCALLLLGFIASQFVVAPYLDRGVAIASLLVGGLVLAMVVAFLALAQWERSGRQTHSWIADAFDTLREQKDKTRVIRLASLTIVIWSITVTSIYWMFSAVFPQFSLSDAGVLTLVLALAIAIPSAPAGLGVVEAAIVAYLHQALQAEPNQALACALAFHFIVVMPQVLATAAILLATSFRRRGFKS
jgi:uncharacterized membrane protein YbhN (UPF0104 family)